MAHDALSHRPLARDALARQIRAHVARHLYDESCVSAEGTALYTLADPRDARAARYVGQTRAPRRRFLQHLTAARLWLPDEMPWWIRSEKYRPLYTWIRALYADGGRLPVMIVTEWVPDRRAALGAERALVRRCTLAGCALLNVEAATVGPQLPLLE